MLWRKVAGFVVLLSLISLSTFAAAGKVETTGAFADASAPEGVKKALEAKGYRVTLGDAVQCEVWFRAGVVGGKTDAPGAVYTGLAESTMVGVISLPKGMNDFRGQAIKPGTYTMRYALHPTDGNHLGISPVRDFLVLVPISADPNPDATFKFEELAKLSTKASNTNHPAAISLVLPDSTNGTPFMVEDEHGRQVLVVKIKTQAGAEMPIALIVKGQAEQ